MLPLLMYLPLISMVSSLLGHLVWFLDTSPSSSLVNILSVLLQTGPYTWKKPDTESRYLYPWQSKAVRSSDSMNHLFIYCHVLTAHLIQTEPRDGPGDQVQPTASCCAAASKGLFLHYQMIKKIKIIIIFKTHERYVTFKF